MHTVIARVLLVLSSIHTDTASMHTLVTPVYTDNTKVFIEVPTVRMAKLPVFNLVDIVDIDSILNRSAFDRYS